MGKPLLVRKHLGRVDLSSVVGLVGLNLGKWLVFGLGVDKISTFCRGYGGFWRRISWLRREMDWKRNAILIRDFRCFLKKKVSKNCFLFSHIRSNRCVLSNGLTSLHLTED